MLYHFEKEWFTTFFIYTCISVTNPNIAFGKDAYQSSTYQNCPAERAVDGILYGDSVEQYAHTNGGNTASQWWMVDLDGLHNITEIYLHGRSGQCKSDVIWGIL